MCGLAGSVEPRGGRSREALLAIASDMADAVRHRGPDDADAWADPTVGVALGHRRLSIVDLTPAGRQPMVSPGGHLHLVFNGEVYNHGELRQALEREGVAFRGHCDAEVLLAAIERWGLERALQASVGMHAFALWDARERVLHLVRDRLGEKPLYYGVHGGALLFGSELKALRRHPAWRGRVDRRALTLFARLSYVPAPWCIHEDVRQLLPGTVLTIPLERLEREPREVLDLEPVPFWSAARAAERGLAEPFRGRAGDAADELERRIREAVRHQLLADVPVGAFLSGGIDSSTVVALAQAESTDAVRTFSIGFEEAEWNEAEHARAVARHLGTDHQELVLTAGDALALIPRLADIHDEPFADPSQLPTHLVATLARRHVKVSLSGDGGDELLAGYDRYRWVRNLWHAVGFLPQPLRSALAALVTLVPEAAWDAVVRLARPVLPDAAQKPHAGTKVHRLAALGRERDAVLAYRRLVSHWESPTEIVVEGDEPETVLASGGPPLPWRDLVQRVSWLDLVTYLPHDILVKVDRAAMACSLETRVPLLDHRVVELALSLPTAMKLRAGHGKDVLRRVLARHVPPELTDRPKAGFGVPIDQWLRGELREWAEALLEPRRLEREGYLRAGPVRAAWEEHLTGRRNHQYRLWNALMFCAWRERWEASAG